MNQLHSKSVIVGIDGSQAGVNAARWAVDEAITRQLPLRLVHVAGRRRSRSTSAPPSDWEVEAGETALYQAEVAVHGVGKPVEVETVLLSGDPEQVLINESSDAALVCVGTDQRRWAVDKLLGATEAALATRAHCPVAIIRTSPDGTPAQPGVIAVVLNDEPDNEEVVHQAMEEGRRRNATVRQIEKMLLAMPQMQDTFAVIGFSLLDGGAEPNSAFMVDKLKPFAERTSAMAKTTRQVFRRAPGGEGLFLAPLSPIP